MTNTNEMKTCPYCGEQVLAVAIKCKHCQSDLRVSGSGPAQHPAATSPDSSAQDIRFFDARTRIGRFRYLAYLIGCYLFALIPFAIAGALAAVHLSSISYSLIGLGYLFIAVMTVLFSIRRLHDMNASGWWALLLVIPLVNFVFELVLMFTPGTVGENRFGPPPPSNSGWVTAGAVTYIVIIACMPFVGILAAIAIPQYQDYIARAKIMEGLNLAVAAKTAVEETYRANGQLPQGGMTSNSSYGLPEPTSISGQYVSSVAVAGGTGVITITYDPNAIQAGTTQNAYILTLTPYLTQTGIGWLCGNTTDQTGKFTGNGTTVPAKYLPANCRP